MAGKTLNLFEREYKFLTPIKRLDEKRDGRFVWLFKCRCGKEVKIQGNLVYHYKVLSCGCWRAEVSTITKSKHLHCTNYSHSSEYQAWRGMIVRCTYPNRPEYKDYGGRGIKVHEEWSKKDGFIPFIKHIGLKPSKHHSLDRIDVNGNYEPGNVRWVTAKEQANNKRNSNKNL